MKRKKKSDNPWRAFLIEAAIYGVLVTGYFFAVLHFLAGWLARLFHEHIATYAVVAILLIIGQAVVLEAVTSGLMKLLHGRTE